MGFSDWEDFQEGDQIQTYEEEKTPRKAVLSASFASSSHAGELISHTHIDAMHSTKTCRAIQC